MIARAMSSMLCNGFLILSNPERLSRTNIPGEGGRGAVCIQWQHPNISNTLLLKDQYGPRVFFLEFPFFAENMIIRSILNLWWHSEILKLILGVVRGMFTKRLKGTRRLLLHCKI